jgi:hypothetical protein
MEGATPAALAFKSLSDNSRSLDLMNRYEARYERQYFRAHRRLLEVQDRRTPPATQIPMPQAMPDPVTAPPASVVDPQLVNPHLGAPPQPEPVPSDPEKVDFAERTHQIAAGSSRSPGVRAHKTRHFRLHKRHTRPKIPLQTGGRRAL